MVKFKKITNEVKAKPEEEIKIDSFYENPRILLIAPHGVEDKPFDDIGTAALVMGLADRLYCHRILNTEYRRPEGKQPEKRNNGVADKNKKVLNLNKVSDATQVPDFINSITQVVEKEGLTYVFWIHGIANENIEKIDKNAHCLIGYGQPNEGEAAHYTATPETINRLIQQLKKYKINAVEAAKDSRYRGWDENYMNQYLRVQGYSLERVQSIQLEFKLGCRNNDNLASTAHAVAEAIKKTIKEDTMAKKNTKDVKQSQVDQSALTQDKDEIPDAEVVLSSEEKNTSDTKPSEAIEENKVSENLPAEVKKVVEDIAVSDDVIQEVYEHLKEIFVTNFQDAASKSMLESGEYLVKKFYGTYEKAQEKKFTRTKSMSKLIKKIRDNASEGNIPSRTWVYDAVNLAIDNYLFKEKKLPSAYGQFGHSQKVNLTYAPNLESKIKMIETLDKPTVAQIRKSIADEKAKSKKDTISFKETIVKDKLKKLRTTTLESYIKQIEEFEKKLEAQKKIYEANRQILAEALEEANKKALDKQQLNKTGKKKSASKTTPKTSTPATATTA